MQCGLPDTEAVHQPFQLALYPCLQRKGHFRRPECLHHHACVGVPQRWNLSGSNCGYAVATDRRRYGDSSRERRSFYDAYDFVSFVRLGAGPCLRRRRGGYFERSIGRSCLCRFQHSIGRHGNSSSRQRGAIQGIAARGQWHPANGLRSDQPRCNRVRSPGSG
jgi:hypothetical protein